MSHDSESEYGYSAGKLFLPVVILSLSVIFFFAWQIAIISQQRNALQGTKQKLEDFNQNSIPKLDDQVAKSKQIQQGLEKLVLDLLELAKTDPDAKAIVTKYNIQQQAPPSSAPTPAK